MYQIQAMQFIESIAHTIRPVLKSIKQLHFSSIPRKREFIKPHTGFFAPPQVHTDSRFSYHFLWLHSRASTWLILIPALHSNVNCFLLCLSVCRCSPAQAQDSYWFQRYTLMWAAFCPVCLSLHATPKAHLPYWFRALHFNVCALHRRQLVMCVQTGEFISLVYMALVMRYRRFCFWWCIMRVRLMWLVSLIYYASSIYL
jgi:hypothetical protein